MRFRRTLITAAPALLLLAACASTPSLAQADLEAEVSTGIAAQIGARQDDVSVTCPGDLEAVVGVTMTCQVTTADDSRDVLITITSVDGADVAFDWTITPAP